MINQCIDILDYSFVNNFELKLHQIVDKILIIMIFTKPQLTINIIKIQLTNSKLKQSYTKNNQFRKFRFLQQL